MFKIQIFRSKSVTYRTRVSIETSVHNCGVQYSPPSMPVLLVSLYPKYFYVCSCESLYTVLLLIKE